MYYNIYSINTKEFIDIIRKNKEKS